VLGRLRKVSRLRQKESRLLELVKYEKLAHGQLKSVWDLSVAVWIFADEVWETRRYNWLNSLLRNSFEMLHLAKEKGLRSRKSRSGFRLAVFQFGDERPMKLAIQNMFIDMFEAIENGNSPTGNFLWSTCELQCY